MENLGYLFQPFASCRPRALGGDAIFAVAITALAARYHGMESAVRTAGGKISFWRAAEKELTVGMAVRPSACVIGEIEERLALLDRDIFGREFLRHLPLDHVDDVDPVALVDDASHFARFGRPQSHRTWRSHSDFPAAQSEPESLAEHGIARYGTYPCRDQTCRQAIVP